MTVNMPRAKVTINGTVVPGVEVVTVTEPVAFNVGTFHFTKCFVPNDPFPPEWWGADENKAMEVEIDMAVDGKTFVRKILGNVDSPSWNPIENSLSVAGRDYGAKLLDTRSFATYRNLTSSQIALQLAANHSLTAMVTNTKVLAGRYYQTDTDQTSGDDFSQAVNEWDLLCRLGSKEGIIPYFQGKVLYFQIPPANPPVFVASFTRNAAGNPVSNVDGLTLSRSLIQARDVIVIVRSWHSRYKSAYSATVRVKTKVPGTDPTQPPTTYTFSRTNFTQAQCLAEAQRIAIDISQHERPVSVSIPSLNLLSPLHQLQVTGTGTDYDLTYVPKKITYEIDAQKGAKVTIDAKISSPMNLYDDNTGEIIGEQA